MRAYPYDAWPKVSSAEAMRLRRWTRAAPWRAIATGGAEAEKWLGARIEIVPGVPAIDTSEPIDAIAVLFERASDGARSAITLDALVAAALVDRTLGGEGLSWAAVTGPPNRVERGVLAYAVARWIGSKDWQVAAVSTRGIALARAFGSRPRIRWPLAIRLGSVSGAAVLWLTDAPSRTSTGAPPQWLEMLPFEAALVCGHAQLDARELADLSPMDVVVPDRCEPHVPRLHVRGSRGAWRCAIRAEGLVVEARDESDGAITRGVRTRDMADLSNTRPELERAVETLGDTPVTLSLELARFELTLGELAGLAPGVVLATGRTIGETVTLRAGDRVVARGELVDVDGQIGVRILELPER